MAIVREQSNNGNANFTNSIDVSFVSAVTSGNMLLCFVSLYDDTSPYAFTISDDNGNSWVEVYDYVYSGDRDIVGLGYALNANSGSTTVTVECNGTGYWSVLVVEVSGIATSSALDQNNNNNGADNSWESGNITTTQASEYLVGAVAQDTGDYTFTPASPFAAGQIWEEEDQPNYMPINVCEYIVSSTGTYQFTGTISASCDWGAVIASFKASDTGATLTVADASCTSQVDTFAITQAHTLVVADAFSTSQVDPVVVQSGAVTLVVDNAFSTSQVDTFAITQAHTLTVLSSFSESQVDVFAITQAHTLTVLSSFSESQVDIFALTQAHVLAVLSGASTVQSDAPLLTQVHQITSQSCAVTCQVDTNIISQLHNLSVAASFSVTQVDELALLVLVFLSPDTDVYDGSWVNELGNNTNLFESVNEATTPNDSDYVQSEVAPSSSAVVLGLESAVDPISSSNHVLRYRYELVGSGTVNLVVQVRQGYVDEGTPGTLIAEWTHNGIGAITTAEQTLSAGQADTITNYADLFVRMVATEV